MKIIILVGISSLFIFTGQLLAECSCDCPLAPQGAIGAPGAVGATGAPGSPGLQGIQGAKGPQGACCPGGVTGGVNLYSSLDQTIAPFGNPGDTIFFEKMNMTSNPFIGTVAAITGDIFITEFGVYQIQYSVEGFKTFPVGNDPSWSVGLYLDNVYIPGSSFASFNDEDEIFGSNGGSVIVVVFAGQSLRLRNNVNHPLSLTANQPGSVNRITSASITIVKLQGL